MQTLMFGPLSIGATPYVAGTLSTAAVLANPPTPLPCDLAEVRLDLIGTETPQWLEACEAIEASGTPVLLTLRLAAEGGSWTAPDADRLPYLQAALSRLAAVDVEEASPLAERLCAQARDLGKTVVVSHHNFDHTPALPELEATVRRILALPHALPKISTMAKGPEDVRTLVTLLLQDWERPLCVIAMGPLSSRTRVAFPLLGSSHGYAYLDTPTAPGQLSAARMRDLLRV